MVYKTFSNKIASIFAIAALLQAVDTATEKADKFWEALRAATSPCDQFQLCECVW